MSDLLRKYKSLYSSTTNTFSTGEAVTITPASVVGLPTDTEITLTFDRVDSSGTKTPSKMERIRGTVVGSNFVVSSGGRAVEGTEQTHTSPVVEMVWNADDWNDMVDWGLVEHGQDGKHTDALVTTLKATGAEINTGTEDAKIVTPKAIADSWLNNGYNSLARQAIINGNFDVAQRGALSGTIPDAGAFLFTLDHWFDYAADDGGTLPTTTRQQVVPSPGTLANSYYFSRLNTNGAGTSLGNSSIAFYGQKIENGVKLLCGAGKKVTVSFYARSNIANKKIGVYIQQCYGTGGSPSSTETITGGNWTMAAGEALTKYTYTFTTNTLGGKTFGTANDDYIQLNICYVWGSTLASRVGATGAETYVGSGYIDIAQVQLCAGDVALPFMPKSFEEELRACQRYLFRLDRTSETILFPIAAQSTTSGKGGICIGVPMRNTSGTIETSTITGDNFYLTTGSANASITAIAKDSITLDGKMITFQFTVASGLTAGVVYFFVMKASGAYIQVNNEL